jgi:predicted secreted hydrolase
MKSILLIQFLAFGATASVWSQAPNPAISSESSSEVPWLNAREGWSYEWPRDHATHAGFKTEWWYFTGNLRTAKGRRFGYQLTFFRQGVRMPTGSKAQSRFVVDDLKFGHFTVTDVDAREFLFFQKLTRGAFGEAGFGDGLTEPRLAWLGSWDLRLEVDGGFRIHALEGDHTLDLKLTPQKRWAVHGENGLSRKAEGNDHASHYYSGTRLRSQGTLTIAGQTRAVEGESWFDHEWATNQLTPQQAGWDWFSLQFDDGAELMLYRLRRKDGTVDPASSGSFIAADGTVRHLQNSEIEVDPLKTWRSRKSGAEYPIRWNVRIPKLEIAVEVGTPVEHQELVLQPVTYWEGLVDLQGSRAGKALRGHGYVELTGYAGPVVGLSSPTR